MAEQSATLPPTSRRSRYREERTLVRALLPIRGQNRDVFTRDARRLRTHYQQFNADVSAICQWLIKLRSPAGEASGAPSFWEFFLEPERFLPPGEDSDRIRLSAFDAAALDDVGDTSSVIPKELQDAITDAAQSPRSKSAVDLFARLRSYARTHRLVLLKAAAEWVLARYVRGYENWERHHEEWTAEKNDWEGSHPQLSEAIRAEFNRVFKDMGVREKRPRICSWEHLQKNSDNCVFAGEGNKRRHSTLCVKYQEFLRKAGAGGKPKWRKHFFSEAKEWITNGPNALHVEARKWFPRAWALYLEATGLSESTVRDRGKGDLPHCERLGEECRFNPHTDKCKAYKESLSKLSLELVEREKEYREWRRLYLAGPSKPVFRYPSARLSSIPKIFGKDYFHADFNSSQVQLRLDDMAPGDFLCLAFKPWPRDYSPQPEQTEVSSVHLHFSGTRPRIGFRFTVRHQPSRFWCTQDELDHLRSRKFPRQSQDALFLKEARERLLEAFSGMADKDVRVLAVDLGTTSAYAAVFHGKLFREAHPLSVVKIDKLLTVAPQQTLNASFRAGLSPEHVGRHLSTISEESAEIVTKRGVGATFGPHDLRGLVRHVGWMLRDWARLNASQIIRMAEDKKVDVIVFESMRGNQAPGYDKLDIQKKRRFAFFAYGRIRRKVIEKAVERGMRVVTVPYMQSSQTCSHCGRKQENHGLWRKNKVQKHLFVCEHKGCGHKANSDENAARVLGRVFWGEIQLPTSALPSSRKP